jgi:hypothetical protein
MAKVDGPLYGVEATGEIGGALAFKRDAVYCRIEKKRAPALSRSDPQAARRDLFLSTRTTWLNLTDEQRATWREGAPAGWTGYNYYLFVYLRAAGETLGDLIFGADLVNQGNLTGRFVPGDYVENFPASPDTIPTYEDGTDPVKAWMLNGLTDSILVVENYLITYKNIIERG